VISLAIPGIPRHIPRDTRIDDIIADLGTFPTTNYADLAAYVENIRARFEVHQTDVTLNQANPDSGTRYTLLPETTNAIILSISGYITWTVQSKLYIYVTCDGIERLGYHNTPISDEVFFWQMISNSTSALLLNQAEAEKVGNLNLKSKSVEIKIRAYLGTASVLYGRCKYAVFE